ncbi:MAG: hypothetical protein KF878_14335 [Planctomycetes bacterium]|nr:hypothetical protein [Planctomycetota bacterium]MCW8137383.1 hypothetical protein [Planctomycetota bacterium]
MGSERRKDYTVSKGVHYLYMVIWITSLLLVAAFAVMVYTLLKANAARDVPEVLGTNPFILVGGLAFVIVCTSLVLGVYAIVHTHRLLGSAYRIGVVLKEANEGKPTRVTLREGDFFMEIGEEINRLLDRVHGKAPAVAESAPSDAPPT